MSTIPPTQPSKSYTNEVRSTLGTGDLIFIHSTSPAGVTIEQLEHELGLPAYSHVGMVINDNGNLFLFDAPGGGCCFTDPFVNYSDNRLHGQNPIHPGCRVAQLDDVLAYYVTKCDVDGFWFRHLSPVVTPTQFGALLTFINRVDGFPFPLGPVGNPEVSGIGLNFLAGQIKASLFSGTYFCAQLVADAYMHMGLLEMDGYPPNGYSPAAFDESGTPRLPLVPTASLTTTVFVNWDWTKPTTPGVDCQGDCP
jgi:hypothetical protein